MESFFKYLKKEETDRHSFASFNELNLALFEYIHGFYNSVRPHSHNNGLSPDHAELAFSGFFVFLSTFLTMIHFQYPIILYAVKIHRLVHPATAVNKTGF